MKAIAEKITGRTATLSATKQKRIEHIGARVTTIGEFLQLTPDQEFLIDFKIDLGEEIKRRRIEQSLTQAQVAALAHITQPRLAALEAGGPSVTVDALLRVLHLLGATRAQVAELLAA